ncbi:hypothetical protein CSE16_06085 [Solibacillus sp. R5-41]|uniref:hypothetical protein n=1 Tax=Solibacillus sp. R5-41 TaxID=2048654 RepID=UPI000C127D8C|nr:hypothetical protein [Solibacillus sp. R5-41]ATP39654.1 hypothetical protein CSE16_06085 [Solibacillus sp. R5-41]
MDNESVNMNDSFQMQQLIIFLKAELAKYKNEVTKHQESDYYSLVVRLDEENSQLQNQNKEFSIEILKLNKEIENKTKNHNEIMYAQEIQRLKQIASIESLLKDKEELRTLNKQLSDELKTAQNELETKIESTNVIRESDLKTAIEKLEQKLFHFTEETGKQMDVVVKNFEKAYKESNESNHMKKYLMKENEEKTEEIEKLQNEINSLKQQNENPLRNESSLQSGKYAKNTHLLGYLDTQMKKMLEQSIDFEEQLDVKLRILNELELKLNQLTEEIEGH